MAPTHEAERVLEAFHSSLAELRLKGADLSPLAAAKGIVLIHSHKGAAVLGYETGTGVLFGVYGHDEDGTPQLSGPIPLKLSKFAVGLQLGFNSVFTIMILFHGSQLNRLISGEAVLGKDLEVSGLPYLHDGSTKNTIHKTSMQSDGTEATHVKVLSVADSFMLADVSLFGGSLGVDDHSIKELYGGPTTALEVIEGKTPMPDGLKAFVSASASAIRALSTGAAK